MISGECHSRPFNSRCTVDRLRFACLAGLVEWAELEVRQFAETFRRQVYGPTADPVIVEESLRITSHHNRKVSWIRLSKQRRTLLTSFPPFCSCYATRVSISHSSYRRSCSQTGTIQMSSLTPLSGRQSCKRVRVRPMLVKRQWKGSLKLQWRSEGLRLLPHHPKCPALHVTRSGVEYHRQASRAHFHRIYDFLRLPEQFQPRILYAANIPCYSLVVVQLYDTFSRSQALPRLLRLKFELLAKQPEDPLFYSLSSPDIHALGNSEVIGFRFM